MGFTYKRLGGSSTSSGGGGGSTPYTQSFLASGWSLNGSVYELTILQSTHGKTENIQVQVYEKVGSNYKEVIVDIEINATGDITLEISSDTDLRFEGKVIIIGAEA